MCVRLAALASLLRRTILGLKSVGNFLLEFMASVLIALTVKLNNVSADYRYIAKKLSKQKRRLKVALLQGGRVIRGDCLTLVGLVVAAELVNLCRNGDVLMVL